jgi:hypothetical protein
MSNASVSAEPLNFSSGPDVGSSSDDIRPRSRSQPACGGPGNDVEGAPEVALRRRTRLSSGLEVVHLQYTPHVLTRDVAVLEENLPDGVRLADGALVDDVGATPPLSVN